MRGSRVADLTPWPDPHKVLKLGLADLGAVKIVGPRTPRNFRDDGYPVDTVRRIGGANTADKQTDVARMAIDSYHTDYDGCLAHAEAIRQRLISGSLRTDAGVCDRGEVEVAPILLPYSDSTVFVFGAIYRLSFRRSR